MAGQTGVVVTLDGEILEPETPLLRADDLAAVRAMGSSRHCWCATARHVW
ncbi:hypothetical protein BZL30_6506 [Mycobacterium kansasii]|uniref:Uncharacterized protein n=1 Tax=Mycobacterium kansasii TaxID=1768 RepID=A0A1V3WVV1_MYCKA|nr:hypothetical protein BZL30_6506 [Mycobacterium kansasii]